jgi:hypothetical protein
MRRLAILILALLVLLTAGSCKLFDMLFYKAPGVSAKDLDSYSGTLPGTEIDTLQTIFYGGMVTGEIVGSHVASSSAWQTEFPPQAVSAFNAIPSIRLLAPFISKMKAKSISVTESGMTDASLKKEFLLDIENESVNVNAQGGTGTATIEKCKADLTATLTASTPPFDADGEAEVDLVVTASDLKSSAASTVTVNTAKVGAKAKGTVSMSIGSTGAPTSVEYNIAADAKIGFSISNSEVGGFSGKFIIEMNYIDSGSLSGSELTDAQTGISSIEFTVKIKVYNNDNELVHEYELNQDDLVNYIAMGLK